MNTPATAPAEPRIEASGTLESWRCIDGSVWPTSEAVNAIANRHRLPESVVRVLYAYRKLIRSGIRKDRKLVELRKAERSRLVHRAVS